MSTETRRLIEQRLREAGLKVTPQRYAVLDYLWRHRTHPTADEIEAAVNCRFPCASRATVYNTLHALREAGLVQEIYVRGGVTRYDIRLEPHHHFICRRCGRIEDVAADRVRVETKGMELNDHEIEGLEVVVHGLCAECRQEEEDGVR